MKCPASFDSFSKAQKDSNSYRLQKLVKVTFCQTQHCQPEFAFADRQLVSLGAGTLTLRELILFQQTLYFPDVIVFLVFIPSSHRITLTHSLCKSRQRGKMMPQDDSSHSEGHIKAVLIKLHTQDKKKLI